MKFVTQLLASLALGLFGSFVMLQLYTWFVVPLGAPNLSLAHIYGLALIKGLIVYRYRPVIEGVTFAARFAELLTIVLLAWGLGAIAWSFL